jgi:hypothetical protein
MSRSATVLGCVLALTVGIQVAEASSCIDHQLVDKLGRVVRDANGNPVACGVDQNAGDPESFAGDQGLYLGAGTLLIGGGIAAALATNNNGGGGGGVVGGGSSQQNELSYLRLLDNNKNPASP